MAEMNVVKKRNSIWPWVFGALLLGLLVWGVAGLLDGDPEGPAAQEQVQ